MLWLRASCAHLSAQLKGVEKRKRRKISDKRRWGRSKENEHTKPTRAYTARTTVFSQPSSPIAAILHDGVQHTPLFALALVGIIKTTKNNTLQLIYIVSFFCPLSL